MPLMSVDIHVVAVLDGDCSSFECMMLVVSVDVPKLDDVLPIVFVVDVASSCHFMMCIMCGKYVAMCRCAFDHFVSWLRKLMRLREFELRGPDIDVWSKRCELMMAGLLTLSKMF